MPYDKELIAHKLIRWEHYLNNYKLPAWKELPDIGLYMDQVIALLGQYLDFIPMEDSKDKPVTPTTINNYVRLKVMPAPEKPNPCASHCENCQSGVGFPYGRRQCKNYHCLPATNCGDDGGSAGRWKDHQRCKAGRPDAEAEWEAPSFSCL